MDKVAEYGIAAHWAYSEAKRYSKEDEQFEIAKNLKWYADLLKLSKDEDEINNAENYVETIKNDLLDANVYVFTPKGEVIELPKGSTPLDFAFRIHTDIGIKCVGSLVNNKIVPLTHELQTGDIVSVKTNKNSLGPTVGWLKIAKSQHAKHKIKGYLNKLNREDLIQTGKSLLETELPEKLLLALTPQFIAKSYEKNGISTLEELYLEIGKGNISVNSLNNKLTPQDNSIEAFLQKQVESTQKMLIQTETGLYVDGLTNPAIKIAQCCCPISGDPIIGYVSKMGGGIIVHRKDCKSILNLEKMRLIDVLWVQNKTNYKYTSKLIINCNNNNHILSDVVQTINGNGNSIAEVHSVSQTNFVLLIQVKIVVSDLQSLNVLITKINNLPDVFQVDRK
jgi:GTP pyrophosphokinase